MATIALGSVKNQIKNTAPPRGLWCDFPLGRPLGVPQNAEFQHQVLAAAFSLLDSKQTVFKEYDIAIKDEGTEVMGLHVALLDMTLKPIRQSMKQMGFGQPMNER